MARSRKARKKRGEPDPIYSNYLVGKLINKVMKDGKKRLAEKHVYNALSEIKKKTKKDPVELFEKAVKTVSPRLEVRSRRVGGAAYQVPVEVRGRRKTHLALKWLIEAAREKPNKDFHTFGEKLAAEIISAAKEQGEAVKKRDTVHKMAEANRAFAHFRW